MGYSISSISEKFSKREPDNQFMEYKRYRQKFEIVAVIKSTLFKMYEHLMQISPSAIRKVPRLKDWIQTIGASSLLMVPFHCAEKFLLLFIKIHESF